MFPLYGEEAPLKLKELLIEFDSVFVEEIRYLKDIKVKIPIEKTAIHRSCWSRPVPHAIKADAEKELHRLEGQGIFKRVEYYRWAARWSRMTIEASG